MISVGNKVPIRATAHDGNPNLKITVVIFGEDNVELFRALLFHVANGVYSYDDYVMPPGHQYLTTLYITDAPADYSLVSEVFLAKEPDEKVYLGEVVEVVDDIFQGVVSEA